MIEWPEDLIRDIARRRCVLFLGAGVSKNASNEQGQRPPDWDEFLAYLRDKVPDPDSRAAVASCITEGDLLTACEIAKKALRPDTFNSELLRSFAERRFQPSKVHEDLVGIDSRIVATTNFDKLYEMKANSVLHGDVIVKSYTEGDIADVVRRQNRCILKLHGTIDTPNDAIFTRTSYSRARTKYAHFYRVVEALFMTHTFIFMGASMRDPDIRLILEDYANRYSGARPHYMVSPEGEIPAPVLEVIEESMNLRTITYDSVDNHVQLAEGIAELKDLVGLERAALRDTLDW